MLPQQIGERRAPGGARAIFRLRSAASDVVALGAGEEFVFAGVAVISIEQNKEANADQAGGRKIPAPSEMQEHEAQHRYPDSRREFRGGVEHRGCQAAFVLWKPVAGCFRVGWKRRGLADP